MANWEDFSWTGSGELEITGVKKEAFNIEAKEVATGLSN